VTVDVKVEITMGATNHTGTGAKTKGTGKHVTPSDTLFGDTIPYTIFCHRTNNS